MSIFLSIDFGERRTGVAVGETETGLVTPTATIQRRSDPQLIAELEALAQRHDAAELVLGLPCRLDGSEGDAARRVRSFADKLASAQDRPLRFVSETLTSREAGERIANLGGARNTKRRAPAPHLQLDAVAAQIIGEQHLNEIAAGEGCLGERRSTTVSVCD